MIAIGCDHGGLELKEHLVYVLQSRGVDVVDMGTNDKVSVDYPDYGRLVSLEVSTGQAERGILVCTSGIGMSILANKFPGVRAALVHDLTEAQMSREHINSNILVLGGGTTAKTMAEQILESWLQTPFAGGRHQRRVDKITQVERELGTHVKD